MSEYHPDAKVTRGSYVERDAIVAAFSDATFVVECGVKSGTMHTVNFAKTYERQIYAYLPAERPEGSYDGNEFILQNDYDAVKIESAEELINDLEFINRDEKVVSSKQTNLDVF